jgi:hypothetical protein
MTRTVNRKVTLEKTHPAELEGVEYIGEYRGTMIRVTRTTDLGYWPGRNPMHEKDATQTYWDGFVAERWENRQPVWDVVAECVGTRREAIEDLKRYIDRIIEGTP